MTKSEVYVSKHIVSRGLGESKGELRLSYRIDGDVEDDGGIDAAIVEIRRECGELIRRLENCKEHKLDAELAEISRRIYT